MGSSLTGLDTSFSSGREFWSSWPLDCSQPGGRVPVTEVMSGGARRRESQKTGGVDSRLKGGHSRRCTTFTIALRTGPKAPQRGLRRRNRPEPSLSSQIAPDRLPEDSPNSISQPILSVWSGSQTVGNFTSPSHSLARLCSAVSEVPLLIWEGQPRHARQAHWGMDSMQQAFLNCCRLLRAQLFALFRQAVWAFRNHQ
jgi:hypothetical protein